MGTTWNKDDGACFPLANALLEALRGERVPFHMPGHRAGRGIPEVLWHLLSELDTTELHGTDDLHHPEGMLKQASERAAAVFGASRSYFLVNGSTSGLLASILAVAGRGDRLLVGRDCHRAVLHGMLLAGVEPVFIGMESREAFFLPAGPSEDRLLEAIDAHPGVAGLILTRPNYYGVSVPLERVADRLHHSGKVLLVDEAHGAHFIADARFPSSALSGGADLVVQSLHKTLPSPTQTALLHEGSPWRGVRPGLPVATLQEALSVVQTSSPSYPLMCLMDAAITWLAGAGKTAFGEMLDRLESFPQRMGERDRFMLADQNAVPAGYCRDPGRLVISAPEQGPVLESFLRESSGIYAEMADEDRVVLIMTPFHDSEDENLLNRALTEASIRLPLPVFRKKPSPFWPGSLPEQVLPYGEAVRCLRHSVMLSDACGRVAAAPVVPYPPGVPVIVPGERYPAEMVAWLLRRIESGLTVIGVEDGHVLCADAM